MHFLLSQASLGSVELYHRAGICPISVHEEDKGIILCPLSAFFVNDVSLLSLGICIQVTNLIYLQLIWMIDYLSLKERVGCLALLCMNV